MKHSFSATALVLAAVASFVTACGKSKSQDSSSNSNREEITQPVTSGKQVDKSVGDQNVQFNVLSHDALNAKISQGSIAKPGSSEAARLLGRLAQTSDTRAHAQPKDGAPEPTPSPSINPALVVGMPIGLLGGEEHLFGGVITAVSDAASEQLGGLKLTDLPPIHVRLFVIDGSSKDAKLGLVGCVSNCSEGSTKNLLLTLPILGVDNQSNSVIVDLSHLSDELDFGSVFDRSQKVTGMKTKSAEVTAVDYSVSTLVFDVKTHMIGKDVDPAQVKDPKVTDFTIRYYLKLASGFHSSFVSRSAAPGVGFFMTQRSAEPKVQRWSSDDFATPPLHYYIKHVPKEWQPTFAASLDEWNEKMTAILGKKMIRYEFVEENDPKNDLLVPGDVRYNVIEWDLLNKAGYGGLGPSIANQYTGEIFHANVLVQGPSIIALYTDWYQVNQKVQKLQAQGLDEQAELELLAFNKRLTQAQAPHEQAKFSLSLTPELPFRVASQDPSLEDPLMQRNDFEILPVGVDYATYMNGYFKDMLEHEVGHTLGLRHNFHGNLGAQDGDPKLGSVSRSVMEYLGRPYRFVDHIGDYDVMAIKYGYKGVAPDHQGWYCTDEESWENMTDKTKASAECSSDDATNDPFSFWEARLAMCVDKLTARGFREAPVWTVADMERELGNAIKGLSAYAGSAAATGSSWLNFFGKKGRPATPADVPAYVLERVKAQICDPGFAEVLAGKVDEAARMKTQANIDALRAKFAELAAPFKGFTGDQLKCQ